MLSFPPWGFWCWPDLVDRPVGGKHVNWHLLDSIASDHTIMYCFSASSSASTGMAMMSPTYPTYNLSCSRIGHVPSSSTFRYGSSVDYTDPFPSGQQFHPVWASCPNSGTHSRSLLVGSNAPVSRVEGGSSLAPLRLYPCYEHKLSLGSKALEDQQMQVRAPLDDLSRSASMTPKSPSGCHAPSHSHSTWCGYAPIVGRICV